LSAFLEAIKFVDILSPNHIELAAFFSIDLSNDEPLDRSIIEELAQKCLASGIGPEKQGTVVVRAGHEGCCVYSRKQKEFVWLPPFYKDSPKVIDPTGAGNAFLGGFAIGLRETADDVLASCYGSIASTFALEQIGLPILEPLQSITTDGAAMSSETWNGTIVRERLQEYTSRLGISLADSLTPPLETRLSHL
jgi:sugar/nucleoside kinase (ribokinase family)